ncbi:Hypothetical protein, putative [Bodo saltans]|uniref:Uncharacterized protein n=1 Tax=Bodo saltans TaxID=75058 RepID=A0A0S4J5T6_BODSA|nr:Hypothetical protein, putative [Bodo saltans]|eukprot:CUG85421.1 Hypothetical protein, putative [Bodo saltans]
MAFSEKIAARINDTSDLDVHLADISAGAECGVQQLNNLQYSSLLVLESVAQAEEIISQLQSTLHEQRSEQNRLKAAIKRKRALLIVTETEAVTDIERTISLLREQSTKLDYDLISCDADIVTANQRLSLARVGVPDEHSDAEDDGVLPESEHAMLENDALFHALTSLPLSSEVDSFMQRMANSEGAMSTQRYIRSLSSMADVH